MKNLLLVVALGVAIAVQPALVRAAEPLSADPTAQSPHRAKDHAESAKDPHSANGHPESAGVLQHFDVEIDPLAYIAQGHSLHLGFRVSRLRFDVGSFSLVVPEFVHGQSDFENQGRGYGLKLDAYLLEPGSGPFVGAEGAWFAQELIDLRSQERAEVSSFMAGGRVGWEIPVGAGFFVRPWVGLSYRFGNDVVTLPGGTFRQSPFGVFPTVHVGYVFQ